MQTRTVYTVKELLGKTLQTVKRGTYRNEQALLFVSGSDAYVMYHEQDCCEAVWLEDIAGDLLYLTGTPILMAEERTCHHEENEGSQTWTFYVFGTVKGYVTLRWIGESNGFYSEEVEFVKITDIENFIEG